MNPSTTLRNRCLPWLPSVFCILLAVSAWAAPEKDFTVVALPDTQYYSEKYPQISMASEPTAASTRNQDWHQFFSQIPGSQKARYGQPR